jgi:hypothetical protein
MNDSKTWGQWLAEFITTSLCLMSPCLMSLACDKPGEAQDPIEPKVAQQQSTIPTAAVAADTNAQPTTDKVSVAKDGTRFDPPVSSDSIPDGAWMCDMNGKVHYAALDKKDGKCPRCSMVLVHKGADGKMHDDHHARLQANEH